MTEPTTHTLDVPGATLTYDVHEPDSPSDRRPLFIFGSPMGASGFEQLVGHFTDRTVITYDPRGMERSTREPGGELTVEVHADDYHRVVEAVGLGPVDAFGSSGGGMCGLHWVVAHPEDVRTFVSHEPPVITLLEDRQMAIKVNADIVDTYQRTASAQPWRSSSSWSCTRACCPTTTWTGPRQIPRSSVFPPRTTAPAMTCC